MKEAYVESHYERSLLGVFEIERSSKKRIVNTLAAVLTVAAAEASHVRSNRRSNTDTCKTCFHDIFSGDVVFQRSWGIQLEDSSGVRVDNQGLFVRCEVCVEVEADGCADTEKSLVGSEQDAFWAKDVYAFA